MHIINEPKMQWNTHDRASDSSINMPESFSHWPWAYCWALPWYGLFSISGHLSPRRRAFFVFKWGWRTDPFKACHWAEYNYWYISVNSPFSTNSIHVFVTWQNGRIGTICMGPTGMTRLSLIPVSCGWETVERWREKWGVSPGYMSQRVLLKPPHRPHARPSA